MWKELQEVLLDVEIALNNRPLQYLEDDIHMPALSPNSMLFVGCIATPGLEAHHQEEADLRKHAKFLSCCKDAVWQKWSMEYLRGLRERHNQKNGTREFKLGKGEVVIIKSDERNRPSWSLGIVDELYPGHDDFVRAIRLRAGKKFL